MAKDKKTHKESTQAPPPIESLRSHYIPHKPKQIDRQLWLKADHWSIEEAAHLLCGINPGFYKFPIKNPYGSLEEHISLTYELLKRSYETGGLKRIGTPYRKGFAPNDIIEWANKKELEIPPELRNMLSDFSEDDKFDSLISRVRVSAENDSEVLIQVHGKKAKSVTWEDLGFQSELSGPWKTFLEIIQAPNNTYDIGQSGTQNYSRKYKQLNRISEMLIKYLNKEYSFNIPAKFKMFERDKAEKTGVYKPKFQIIDRDDIQTTLESRYNKLPDRELISEIKILRDHYISKQDENIETKFVTACDVAIKKGYITERDVEQIIKPSGDKKFIEDLFAEERYEDPSILEDPS